MAETRTSVVCVAEPHSVPRSPLWFSDLNNGAAIHWSPRNCYLEAIPVESGEGFVAARVGTLRIYSVYLPPNKQREVLEERLDRIADSIRRTGPSPVVIAGDFNAASVCWGSSHTNSRGDSVEDWAASLDLVLLTRGSAPTCIRAQGTSIVDLTWCSPEIAPRVDEWPVLGMETLSDHALIQLRIKMERFNAHTKEGTEELFPRWSSKNMDQDLLIASLILKD